MIVSGFDEGGFNDPVVQHNERFRDWIAFFKCLGDETLWRVLAVFPGANRISSFSVLD